MTQVGSYRAETFAIGLDHEIRRLNAQVDLFWGTEQAILERAGVSGDLRVLDCGCGPGRLIELLKRTHPGLHITGLEIDPVLIDAANERFAAAGLEDCTVVQGSAEEPGLPDGSFDVIVMRLVLEHVIDPVVALERLSRLLVPGGRLVIISNDFEFHERTWPPVPELDDMYAAYRASRRDDGGDPTIARRLPALFAEAGLDTLAFEMEAAHSRITGDRIFLLAEGGGIPAKLVETGYLDADVFERMVENWRAMLEHPDHSIIRPLFVGVARVPGGADDDETAPTAVAVDPLSQIAEADYVAPSTELEREIASIWAEAMDIEKVGVNSNFFDLGGNSLMLEKVHVELEQRLGVDLQVTALFQHPTVSSLAAFIGSAGSNGSGTLASSTTSAPTGTRRAGSNEQSERARRRRGAARRR